MRYLPLTSLSLLSLFLFATLSFGTGSFGIGPAFAQQQVPVLGGEASEAEPAADSEADADADARMIEELDLEALLADPVVTSSGGFAEERVLAFANVVVVSRDEIKRHAWSTLAEVLSNTPGLYVIQDYVVPSVNVRGVSGGLRGGTRLIKVMINGVPVHFRPDLTAFLGPEFIPMAAVERVEIVQGPLSALYGANAFIATVNVVTREPRDLKAHWEIAARMSGMIGGESERTGNIGGGLSLFTAQGGPELGIVAAFSIDRIDRSGLQVDKTFGAQDPSAARYAGLLGGRGSNDLATPMSAFAQLYVCSPEDWGKLSLQGGYQRLDSAAEFQVNSAMSHRSRVAIDNAWSSLRYERSWSDSVRSSIELGFAAGGPTRDYQLLLRNNFSASYEPAFDYRAWTGSIQVHWEPLGERLRIRLGVDGELDQEEILYYQETLLAPVGARLAGDSVDLVGSDAQTSRSIGDLGFGVQLSSVPLPEQLPGLRVAGNLRGDVIRYSDIDFPTQLSWRAGVVYDWGYGIVTKLIGGRAFQTPSPVLMFTKGGFGNANNVVGNVDAAFTGVSSLRPQTVTGVEAIVSLPLFGKVEIDIGPYYQLIEDRIGFAQLATDFVAENGAEAQSVGLLASVKANLGRFGGYATFTGQLAIDDGALVSDAPEGYPTAFGTAGLNVDLPEAFLRSNLHLRWATSRGASQSNVLLNNNQSYSLDGYADLDLTVTTHGLYLWDDDSETEIAVSVRNLLDSDHSEPGFAGFDIPNQGRSFWVQVQQSF